MGLNPAAIDRLTLTPKRLEAIASSLEEVAALPDPLGEVVASSRRPNGLDVTQVRVPLGVIFMIYESRPNVTVDAASLCVKSGNAAILRGGKEATHSNRALHRVLADELAPSGLPEDAVQLVSTTDRSAVGHFLGMPDRVDLAIPRGGESLIRRVVAEAKMPVMKHYTGIATSTWMPKPISTRPSGSSSTPRPIDRASATPPRPSWSTETPRPSSCRSSPRPSAPRGSS